MAMTEGDNRNVMTAQLATEALGAKQVIAKINDPLRARAYAELGHRDALPDEPDGDAPSATSSGSGSTFGPGLSPPTGQHPGGEHHLGRPPGPRRLRPARPAVGPGAGAAAADGTSPDGSIPTPLASTTAREG